MRKDLNKVIVERQRIGSKNGFKSYRRAKVHSVKVDLVDGDAGQPSQEGMTARYNVGFGDYRKQLNENLNPLKGVVRKAVGRPWDKFYSELCQSFNMRSVVNHHILEHLEDFVNYKRVFVGADGNLVVGSRWSLSFEPLAESSTELYVDPRDGIIKRNKHFKTRNQLTREYRAKKSAQSTTRIVLSESAVLEKIDDVWFEFELRDIPEGRYEVIELKYTGAPETRLYKNYKGREVTWEELAHSDRVKYGHQIFFGKFAKDVLTGEELYRKNGLTFRKGYTVPFSKAANGATSSTATNYHASKKTASHKTLKKAGLL